MIQNPHPELITRTTTTTPAQHDATTPQSTIQGPRTKIKASTHLGITIRRAAPAPAGEPVKITSGDLEQGWCRC